MYFSRKMNRLVLLLAPVSSILGGITIAGLYEWSLAQFGNTSSKIWEQLKGEVAKEQAAKQTTTATTATTTTAASDKSAATTATEDKSSAKKKKKNSTSSDNVNNAENSNNNSSNGNSNEITVEAILNLGKTRFLDAYNKMYLFRLFLGVGVIFLLTGQVRQFWGHSTQMAAMLSNPSIILQAQTRDGQLVKLDDFREAYWWIRDNTPEDARVLSWWDYGYQISQIANRTTLADGNTWNHEHIALLGKILVSSVKDSHNIARHLADYVLVWSTRFVGYEGDDVAKSPHMARIGGSVFKDVKPDAFYIDRQGKPSKMMRESLVYNLVLNGLDPNVPPLSSEYYQEAYTSSNRMVRVYKVMRVSKDSKRYCAENRGYQAWLTSKPLLDAYPPALNDILAKREAFQQLEDFNAPKAKASASTTATATGEKAEKVEKVEKVEKKKKTSVKN